PASSFWRPASLPEIPDCRGFDAVFTGVAVSLCRDGKTDEPVALGDQSAPPPAFRERRAARRQLRALLGRTDEIAKRWIVSNGGRVQGSRLLDVAGSCRAVAFGHLLEWHYGRGAEVRLDRHLVFALFATPCPHEAGERGANGTGWVDWKSIEAAGPREDGNAAVF